MSAGVPEHWHTFGARISPLSGSPRLAANPPNAILNYLYALLESEARLAAAALGLDPGLGVLHVDTPNRDSLACDLMEPVRPQVDAFVLDWITREPLSRQWFFEQRDGNCRLMAPLAIRLSETVPTWGRAVAPFAEWGRPYSLVNYIQVLSPTRSRHAPYSASQARSEGWSVQSAGEVHARAGNNADAIARYRNELGLAETPETLGLRSHGTRSPAGRCFCAGLDYAGAAKG